MVKFFTIITKWETAEPINRENGRLFQSDGARIYSPNSRRAIPPPRKHYFQHVTPRDTDIYPYLEPRWWSDDTPYLPFIPVKPNLVGVPLQTLMDLPYHKTRHGYRADVCTILRWGNLETEIRHITMLLARKYDVPLGQDIMGDENAMVCSGTYSSPEEFKKQLRRTQAWFSVHMAKLSWIIAVALASDKENISTEFPTWMQYLLESHLDSLLVHSIRASAAAFSDRDPFVGVFVDLSEFNPSHPSIQFLVRHKVPVWYRWSLEDEKSALSSPYLQRYAPLAEHYLPSNMNLTADSLFSSAPDYSDALPELDDGLPSSSNPTGSGQPLAHNMASTSDQSHSDRPWIDLFARRDAKRLQLLVNQTARSAQACRDRERNMPRKNTTIWEWGTVDGRWVRERVEKKMYSWIFEHYGANQRQYDAYFNEWDCCSAWGEKTADEIDADDWEDEEEAMADAYLARRSAVTSAPKSRAASPVPPPTLASPAPVPASWSSAPRLRSSSPIPHPTPASPGPDPSLLSSPAGTTTFNQSASVLPPSPKPTAALHPAGALKSSTIWVPAPETALQDTQTAFDWDPRHLTDDLFEYFGFLIPQPLPRTVPMPTTITDSDCLTLSATVGHRGLDPGFRNGTAMQLCKQFVEGLTQSDSAPPSRLHNLSPGPRCVSHAVRFRFLVDMCPKMFTLMYLDLPYPTVPWKIAVTNAMDALFLCRLNPFLNEVQIVSILLQRGVKFHTFLETRIRHHYPPPSPSIPIRMISNPPTQHDYLAYVEERNKLFQNPRIRCTALKAGGILWRLAMSTVNYLEVLDGPSSVLMLRSIGEFLPGRHSGLLWCDDGISDAEADILCGTVHRYDGGKRAILSWWPTDTLWQSCIAYTHWTETSEKFFDDRAAELQREDAQPLSSSQWRNRFRSHNKVRKAKKETVLLSERLLQPQLLLRRPRS